MNRSKIIQILKQNKVKVDSVWEELLDYIGINGLDVACYMSEGVSVWPCGECTDIQEDDECDDCKCGTCERVRSLITDQPQPLIQDQDYEPN